MAKKRKVLSKKLKRDLTLYICVVAYFAMIYAISHVYIKFNAILLLFQSFDPEAGGVKYIWADPIFHNFQRFWREFFLDDNKTLRQSLWRGPLSYIIGFAVGFVPGIVGPYYIHKKMPGGRFFKMMFFLPGILGAAVLVIMYTNTVEVFVPALVRSLTGKEIEGLFANPKTVFITLMARNIWLGAGAGGLLYIGTMNTIPGSLSEAMQLDGANNVHEIIYLAFPTIYPIMSIGLWMGIPGILVGVLPVYEFFGPGAGPGLYTLGYYLAIRTLLGENYDYPYVSTMNFIICVVSLPMIFAVRYLLERFGPSTD